MTEEIKKSKNPIKFLYKNKFVQGLVSFFKETARDNVGAYAGSCAFFIFISLIPMLILICSILPYTPINETDLVEMITDNMQNILGKMLASMVTEAYSMPVGVASFAAIATLWSAGKGVNALVNGLNAIEHVSGKRNYFLMRLFSLFYTIIFLASVIVFILFVVYGNAAKDVLVDYYPGLNVLFSKLIHFRPLIVIVFMTVVFMIFYSFLPSVHNKFLLQFFGALFAAVTWVVFSFFFSLYVERYGAFSMYGSFTTMIVLCVWLYFCMFFVFIGANINKYFRPMLMVWDKRYAKKHAPVGQKESLED